MLSNDASRRVDELFDALDRAGVDPQQFAAFLKNAIGSDGDVGGDDNVPGFEYLQRVTSAAVRALTAHAEEINGAWSEIRRGRFGPGMAMQSWARVVENYYGIVTEAWRGPSPTSKPAWLVIPYSKSKPPAPSFSVLVDVVVEKDAKIDYTPFERLGGTGSSSDIYADPLPHAVGSRIEFRLDDAAIQGLPDGSDYVGFIFQAGRGSTTPLVVILLRVT